jgi:hypothetical protein
MGESSAINESDAGCIYGGVDGGVSEVKSESLRFADRLGEGRSVSSWGVG